VRYSVIYADPPWKFRTHSAKGKDRAAERWYDCLTVPEICALPVSELAAPDCVLLLWVTDPFLQAAQQVIGAWGFTYKTVGFYWIKRHWAQTESEYRKEVFPIGTGYWTRANPEQCLLATRGSPRRRSAAVPKLIVAPRREHSRKPDEAYDRIEALCAGPYVELFARQRRAGWASYGNEVDLGLPATRRPLAELIEGEKQP
jgi:N6-adenosine-specific RNA methylase IME4